MNSEAYSLESIQVRFGSRLALDIGKLAIPKGGLHILMGPNGSGKSTLLSALAFLKKPDSGQVAFSGSPVKWSAKELDALRKEVTLLHQDSYLFAGSVMANVGFGLKIRGAKREEIDRCVKNNLARVGLAGFEARVATELSGGEARRVALARALACSPRVLLLDEPLAHVDQNSAEIIESLITSQALEGTTIVMSSHDDRVGERLPSRILRLSEGRILSANS